MDEGSMANRFADFEMAGFSQGWQCHAFLAKHYPNFMTSKILLRLKSS